MSDLDQLFNLQYMQKMYSKVQYMCLTQMYMQKKHRW